MHAIKNLVLLCLALCLPHGQSFADTVTWNLKAKYGGITQTAITRAIGDAKLHFAEHPDDTVVIEFDAGTYPLAAPVDDSKGIIELSGIKPGPNGRLVFRGAGMNQTTLVFDLTKDQIHGRNVYRVSFVGLHMTRKEYSVSQGHVIKVAPGQIDLEIQSGFPTPQDIFNPDSRQGRYLRRFTDSRSDPQMILEDNDQIPWKSAQLISGRQWRLNLTYPTQVANYHPGDLIGIKSKHGGQPYFFYGGSDFVFEDVKWTQESRGVFRGGFDKIRITRCVVERAPALEGQTPCLSTPGGGPQIGQPEDPPTSGNLVEDCCMTGTGDDSIAFFNASGTIRNCRIADCFGRGILLYKSPSTQLDNNILTRSVILKQEGESPRHAKKANPNPSN